MTDELEEFFEGSGCGLTIPAFTCGGMSKTSHTSVVIVSVPSKIQTENLLNTSLGHYF